MPKTGPFSPYSKPLRRPNLRHPVMNEGGNSVPLSTPKAATEKALRHRTYGAQVLVESRWRRVTTTACRGQVVADVRHPRCGAPRLLFNRASVSGLSGIAETAQDQVSIGMGLLAGSTVMLLTVIWGSCVVVGRCDLCDSVAVDGTTTKRFHLTEIGVSTDIPHGHIHQSSSFPTFVTALLCEFLQFCIFCFFCFCIFLSFTAKQNDVCSFSRVFDQKCKQNATLLCLILKLLHSPSQKIVSV
ncbi:Vacuolar calcium ion transporter [Gossypium australe]|uniref:Vacuolar calcium ion transporter n=1 Tax=Gossypium australe TaxID=47621 RepID=A0A5B6WVG7_9ROSI|nr:Vacuolar calcium ion transporter [Gossypium australe]